MAVEAPCSLCHIRGLAFSDCLSILYVILKWIIHFRIFSTNTKIFNGMNCTCTGEKSGFCFYSTTCIACHNSLVTRLLRLSAPFLHIEGTKHCHVIISWTSDLTKCFHDLVIICQYLSYFREQ